MTTEELILAGFGVGNGALHARAVSPDAQVAERHRLGMRCPRQRVPSSHRRGTNEVSHG
jgi:hypothetical protein